MAHLVKPHVVKQQSSSGAVHYGALTILMFLTLSRTSVAFQFQSVTPTIGYLRETLPFSSTGYGLLLGIYMAPGALMAVVSPILANRFGNVTTLVAALVLMAIAQTSLLLAPSMELAYLVRLIAGAGGCLVYVLTIDLAAQLCDAGQMPGRMGMIAASWPFGNALSLVVLGVLTSINLPGIAALTPAVLALAAALLVGWTLAVSKKVPQSDKPRLNHQKGQTPIAAPPPTGTSLGEWKQALTESFAPGMTFALYNVSFILFISFTPELLGSQGYTPLAASNIASLPMWLFVFSVPIGGFLAGRWPENGKWLVALGCLGGATCIVCSQLFEDKAIWYMLAGILGGLPTGPMLVRAGKTIHNLFYSTLFFIFFVTLLISPPIVGAVIEATGEIRSLIVFCVTLLVVAFLCFIRSLIQGDSSHV
ncbi:MFS transporter [Paralcaligenes ureilyticus]|uniref:MFS transporter n=1 Tax=Paralcaligenes ureilyticus TaxID=627131 RepID=A0A4R3M7V6_9BURK|nr:MFS transporter [Paralcaligenes ureilyticus]TCT09581.1 MFS transporter [Paralcaligenes ureilyticus]